MGKVTEQMVLDTVESMLNKVTQKHADEIKALELEIAKLKGELKVYKDMNLGGIILPQTDPVQPSCDPDFAIPPNPGITLCEQNHLEKSCTLVQ